MNDPDFLSESGSFVKKIFQSYGSRETIKKPFGDNRYKSGGPLFFACNCISSTRVVVVLVVVVVVVEVVVVLVVILVTIVVVVLTIATSIKQQAEPP